MFKRYVFIEGLTNLLGSHGKYLINIEGQIKDIKGNDINYRRDDEGQKVVHCIGFDGERDYRVIDLVAIQFKSLHIPFEDYGKIIAFVIDGDPDNIHARNIGYRFQGGKLPYKALKGFYYVPSFTILAINKQGTVVNTKTNHFLTYNTIQPNPKRNIKGGYRYTSAPFQKGKQFREMRHRLLCLTFKDYPNHVDSLVVNHINGIPGKDDLDNLEWTTRGDNNLHAYVNDLKNQHLRVLVRYVLTGEVVEYYSISECSRQLGYAVDETIRYRLYKSPFGQVFQDGTQIKLKSDERDWIIPANPEEDIKRARQHMPLLVRDCKDLSIKSYSSITEAAKTLDINSSSIEYRFKVNNQSPLFGYQFKELTDPSPWKEFSQEEFKNSLEPNNFRVGARNLLTGEMKEFSSIRMAEKELKLGINYYLSNGKQALFESGWHVKLENQDWEVIEDFEEKIYKMQKDIMCREETTGIIIIADSADKLSKILKLDSKAIRKASFTRGNKLYHGYRFRLGVSNDPWPETVAV